MITADQEPTDILRNAAARATLAPSIHNTQPWRFRLGRHSLEMLADPDRQLRVIDPGGRQLMISCGCALFNARVGGRQPPRAAGRTVPRPVTRIWSPASPSGNRRHPGHRWCVWTTPSNVAAATAGSSSTPVCPRRSSGS